MTSTRMRTLGLVLFGVGLAGCADDETEAIDATRAALVSEPCTTVPSPPLGTTNTNIGYFAFAVDQRAADQTFKSPNARYGAPECPKQYLLQILNTSPPAFGTSERVDLVPVWTGGALNSNSCGVSHVALKAWKLFLLGSQWSTTPDAQVAATGSWEAGKCVFRNEATGGTNLAAPLVLNPYEDVFRIAVQGWNSNMHTVSVRLENSLFGLLP